jgi:hypothetical protein
VCCEVGGSASAPASTMLTTSAPSQACIPVPWPSLTARSALEALSSCPLPAVFLPCLTGRRAGAGALVGGA